MADLDVALRLRLINGLKAGATDAKRDLAGIGEAAKAAGKARGFDTLGRDIDKTDEKARRLKRDLDALAQSRGGSSGRLGTLSRDLADADGRVARLHQRLNDLRNLQGKPAPLVGSQTAAQRQEALARAAEHVSAALDREREKAAALRRELERVGAASERFATAGGRAARGVDAGRAAAMAQANAAKAGGTSPLTAGLTGGVASRFGAGALGIGGGAFAAGALAKRVITTYADLQTAAKALAITAEQTDATVAQTVEHFRSLGPSLGATPKEMIETAKAFVEAGLDYRTAVDAVLPTVKTARASFGELPETAKAGVAAVNNLDIAVSDLPEAFDRMAKAGKEGNVELKNLARVLPSVAASGSKLGLTGLHGLTDISAALEILGKVTATPDEAANRLQNFFEKITADETVKALDKLGKKLGKTLSLEDEVKKGALRGESALAVMLRLAKELTGGDAFRINELFGDQQAREGVGALLKFEAQYNAIRTRINSGSKGLVDQDFKRANDRIQADFGRLSAAWDRLAGRIGGGLAPGISDATKELTAFLERLEQGDTVAQRLIARFTGFDPNLPLKELELPKVDGQNTLEEWFEKKLPWLSGTKQNEWIDEKIGKTNADAIKKFEQDRPLGRPLRMGVDPTAPIQGQPGAITPGIKSWQDQYPLDLRRQQQKAPLPPSRPAGLPSGSGRGIDSIDEVLGPKDLSAPATQTIDTYNQAIKAGLERTNAEATALVAALQARLSFTATPTIAPRISAPSGGGATAAASAPAAPVGGGASRRAALRQSPSGNVHIGTVNVHGVRDMASLQRSIQREADRAARSARNDALHDTGRDFA